MKKEEKTLIGFALFAVFMLIIIMFVSPILQTSLFPIGKPLSIKVEQEDGSNLTFVFHTNENYYVQEGCTPADGSNINGCDVTCVQVDTAGGCPIKNCSSPGTWIDCEKSIWLYGRTYFKPEEECAYGRDCGSNPYCERGCTWSERDYGLRGGIDYDRLYGCSWYMEVFDDDNNLVQRYSKIEEVNGWDETRPFTTTKIVDNDLMVTYPKNTEYDEESNDCRRVSGAVRGERYRYIFCKGLDCAEPLQRECTLLCEDGFRLNSQGCLCEEIPPECSIPSDCFDKPHDECEGEWSCEESKCNWTCDKPSGIKIDIKLVLMVVVILSIISIIVWLIFFKKK